MILVEMGVPPRFLGSVNCRMKRCLFDTEKWKTESSDVLPKVLMRSFL